MKRKFKTAVVAGLTTVIAVGSIIYLPLNSNYIKGKPNVYYETLPKTKFSQNTTGKEEVIYIITDAAGNVINVNAVNIFGKGEVTDYGTYSAVKILNSTENINYGDGKVDFITEKDRVYYQGTMENAEIPWNINITYTLDGEQISPENLAGKSGNADIHISITKNDKCNETFYNNYALQVSLTLDTEKCENIKAEDATIANVGSDKQISYTVLPGKGLDAHITADVTNFEMDAITINGVRLNLNVDVDDSELMEKVDEIKTAVSDLNDGAIGLDNGADDLSTGIIQIKEALAELNINSAELNNGSREVMSALTEIQNGLSAVSINLDDIIKLSKTSTEIKNGINSIPAGLNSVKTGIDVYYDTLGSLGVEDGKTYNGLSKTQAALLNTYNTVYAAGGSEETALDKVHETAEALFQTDQTDKEAYLIASLGYPSNQTNSDYSYLAYTIQNFARIYASNSVISSINEVIDGEGQDDIMAGVIALQKGYEEYDKNIRNLCSALGNMEVNMDTLRAGIDKLVEQYGVLINGTETYTDGVAQILAGYEKVVAGMDSLHSGIKELKAGTGEFENKTSDLDTEVSDKIDELVSHISGNGDETVSFTSDKNTGVQSVQFVIKTSALLCPAAD